MTDNEQPPYEQGMDDYKNGWEHPPREYNPVQKLEWLHGWMAAQNEEDAEKRAKGEIYMIMRPEDAFSKAQTWVVDGNPEGYTTISEAEEEALELGDEYDGVVIFKFVKFV